MFEQITSPIKAIRAKCIDCCNGQASEVKLCPMEGKCMLWPFRFGKNPFTTRTLTEEQKEAARERMKTIKGKQNV